jgi:hypothetical protein
MSFEMIQPVQLDHLSVFGEHRASTPKKIILGTPSRLTDA